MHSRLPSITEITIPPRVAERPNRAPASAAHGRRVGEAGPELLALWAALGTLARDHVAGLLCPSAKLLQAAGPQFRAALRTQNGGLPVTLLVLP